MIQDLFLPLTQPYFIHNSGPASSVLGPAGNVETASLASIVSRILEFPFSELIPEPFPAIIKEPLLAEQFWSKIWLSVAFMALYD